MQNRMIYVVFSATPLKVGSIIRVFTGEKYNHVSISFDPKLKTMYSYARYYKKAPLYAGLVKETPARYRNDGRTADICVCAIPMSKEQCRAVKRRLHQMCCRSQECRYNLLSASLALFSRRVFVPHCYTCIEFVTHILSMVCPEVYAGGFYSIEALRQLLIKNEIYSGPFPDIGDETDEVYEKDVNFFDVCRLSYNGEKELIKAYLNRDK